MTEPRRDLNEILFAQDAGDGMKIVASTLARSEDGALLRAHWKGKLAPYYRLKYDPEIPCPPEEAFTYVALGDGYAAVLKRVRGASTAGRNFSHALVGARELLDELALPLTYWLGWYNEQDSIADPLEDRDVDDLRTRILSYEDTLHTAIQDVPRDKVIGLVARVLSEPAARFTVVGIDPPEAPTVLALVRHIVTDLTGMKRGWTFSTFEANREPKRLPDFVFMPLNLGALEDSGGARTVVDLLADPIAPDDEARATTLVDLYLKAWRPDTRDVERARLLAQLKRKVQELPSPGNASDGHADQRHDVGRHHVDADVPDEPDVDEHESGQRPPEMDTELVPDTGPDPAERSWFDVTEVLAPEAATPDTDSGETEAQSRPPLADAVAEDLELVPARDTATAAKAHVEAAQGEEPVHVAETRQRTAHYHADVKREETKWRERWARDDEARRHETVAHAVARQKQEEERQAMARHQVEEPSTGVFPNFVISNQETLLQALNDAKTSEETAQILSQATGLHISPGVRGYVWHVLTNGRLRAILNEPDESRKQLVMATILDLLVGRREQFDYLLPPDMMAQWLDDNVGQHFGAAVKTRAAELAPPHQPVQDGTAVPRVWVLAAVGVTFIFAVMIGILLGTSLP